MFGLRTAWSNSPVGCALETSISALETARLRPVGGAVADNERILALSLRGIRRRAAAIQIKRIRDALRQQELRQLIQVWPTEYGSCLPSATKVTTVPSAFRPMLLRGISAVSSALTTI